MEALAETEALSEVARSLEQKLGGEGGKVLLVVLEGRSTLLEQLAEPTFSVFVKA